jgi:predicted HicB family RNase H-like nuclease
VKKTLPLRIDEPLYLKLKFIAERTPYSINSFILDRVIDEIEEEIARLTE